MFDSIIEYDVDGYRFVGMSASWKQMCLGVPDSERVRFPGYDTACIQTTINGADVIIQAWKGNCMDPVPGLPGGIGGEVGIYKLIPGKQLPSVLDVPIPAAIPKLLRPIVRHAVSGMIELAVEALDRGIPIWWPYPELDAEIQMTLRNPVTGDVFFTATPPEPAGGYWLSRWMRYESYVEYALAQHDKVPESPTAYTMELTVGGQPFHWDTAQLVAG